MNNFKNKYILSLLIGVFILFICISGFLIFKYNNLSKNGSLNNDSEVTGNKSELKYKNELGAFESYGVSSETNTTVGYKYITVSGKLVKAYAENSNYYFVIDTFINNQPLEITLDLGSADKTISQEVFKLDDPNNSTGGYTQSLEEQTVAQMYNIHSSQTGNSFKFYITTKPGIENKDDPKCNLYCQNVITEYEKYSSSISQLINNSPEVFYNQPFMIGGVYTYNVGAI